MKRCLLLIVFLTAPFFSYAQDIIVKTNGQMIKCKVSDVDSSRVYFVLTRGEIKTSIARSDVKEIKYNTEIPDKAVIKPLNETGEFKRAVTIGVLEGGGSFVGFDYEMMLTKSAGVQFGAGIIGYGIGINQHFKRTIRSSFLSLQYWHQGLYNSHTQSLIGPNIVFRDKRWFTCQIGFGIALDKGPAWDENTTKPPVMLTYAIGGYIPFK